MSYGNKLIQFYNDKSNIGFIKLNYNMGWSVIGAPICGDFIEFFILVNKDLITDSKFRTYGCGSAVAVSAFLSYYIKYKNIYNIFYIKNDYIAYELNLPLIKFHCSVLAEDVLKSSIINYKNNYLFYDFK